MLSMEAYAPQAFLKQNGAQNECYVFLINRAIVVSNGGNFFAGDESLWLIILCPGEQKS